MLLFPGREDLVVLNVRFVLLLTPFLVELAQLFDVLYLQLLHLQIMTIKPTPASEDFDRGLLSV